LTTSLFGAMPADSIEAGTLSVSLTVFCSTKCSAKQVVAVALYCTFRRHLVSPNSCRLSRISTEVAARSILPISNALAWHAIVVGPGRSSGSTGSVQWAKTSSFSVLLPLIGIAIGRRLRVAKVWPSRALPAASPCRFGARSGCLTACTSVSWR
jgi:hypothetical protein